MMAPASQRPSPRRILVRGVNWLGDAVMTTPALLRLREAHPHAAIALLTPAKLADLWRGHPALDTVLTFEPGESPLSIARRLRAERFDTALILPNSPRSALESVLARIPQRIGSSRSWRNLLLTEPVPARAEEIRMHKRSAREVRRLLNRAGQVRSVWPPRAHQIHHYLHLAAALGATPAPVAPQIAVSNAEVQTLRAKFDNGPHSARPLFGLNAGAEYGPAKRWPRERFVAAAVALQKTLHCQWWILGGPGDRELAEAIAREIQSAKAESPDTVRSLAGQTTLRELCSALKACDVVLTNDSGPMHLAAAVGTPVVALFGSTSPELTAPGLPGDERHVLMREPVACAPCFLRECPVDFRCMNGITVESVVSAVQKAHVGRQ
jgi:heptosyltransferase-2